MARLVTILAMALSFLLGILLMLLAPLSVTQNTTDLPIGKASNESVTGSQVDGDYLLGVGKADITG
jgi:hypothetical protein